MKRYLSMVGLLLTGAGAVAATFAAVPAPVGTSKAAFAGAWQSAGLQPQASRTLDLVYSRPGALDGTGAVQIAPVRVELRPDWQRADRELERMRVRPEEVAGLKDEVGTIVGNALRREFAGAHAGAGRAPVLEARVVDLYLNAPQIKTADATRTYTRSFGDMVLVAELRDGDGGPLLLGSWDHDPAREYSAPRLTTRVENAIELRLAAQAWAKQLHRELDRLGAGG